VDQAMQSFLQDFRETIETAPARLRQISAPDSQRHLPDKWSAREVIGHLVDSAANNHQRFVRAQFSDDLVFPGYQQAEWVKTQHYNDEDWEQLIQLWQHYNLHLVHLIQNTSPEQLTKPRAKHNLHEIAWQTVPVDQSVTLEYFMRDYLDHLKHHLRQIFGA
jgi:hypothetical protein